MKLKHKKGMDVLLNTIKPGDYIVYGAAKGRCAGLNIGRVIGTKSVNERWGEGKMTVIMADAIVVEWGEYRRAGVSEYTDTPTKPRPVRLDFPERICVIPESIVPDAIKALLA